MAEKGQIFKTWTEIKTFLIVPKELKLQYHEYQYYYHIFVLEAGEEYFTELWTDTSQVKGINVTQNNIDKTDFEDNYKVGTNQAIEIDVTIENDRDIGARYRPKLFDLHDDIEVNTETEYTLLDFSGNGQLDFISINCDGVEWEFILEVDGTEIYRLDKNMLKTVHLLNKTSEFIHLEARFVECYPTPIDFITSLKVKVKNLDNVNNIIRSALIRYREKV